MPKRVVLNLQQMRAERSATLPVIVDFDGKEHIITRPSVDAILALMEIENEFEAMRDAETSGAANSSQQIEMIMRLRDLITAILPGFPVGGLQLEELMMVGQSLQASVAPDGAKDEGAEPGE